MLRRSLLVVTLSAACGGGESSPAGVTSPGPSGGSTNPNAPVSTNAVTVSDNNFSPVAVQVAPGTTVRWTWTPDAREHSVRFADGTGSEILVANATFAKTFPTTGTFTYQCSVHATMTGSVTVR